MNDSNTLLLIDQFSKLVMTRTWPRRDSRLEKMERLYDAIDHGRRPGIVLCFALAKVYDDLNEVDKSFTLLSEGNRYHKAGKQDTIEDARQTVAGVKSVFASRKSDALSEPASCEPIFILGMPRSGTSLVEQILASHPRVSGGGELPLMSQWCVGFLRLHSREPATVLSGNYLQDLRRHYFNGIRQLGLSGIFTDKMPQNFLWIGFILSAIPSARIVHTVRDAMAVCWSVFKTDFAGNSHAYACDLQDIGEFYKLYVDLMSFWQEKFPDRIYTLDYDLLTREQESETRKLLVYCGLEWDPSCLDFHLNPRRVKTASREQVKQAMYRGSSEAWKRYDPYLEPLKQALGPIVSNEPL